MDLLVTAVVGVIAGVGIGILVSGRLDRPNRRTRALEAELETARTELASYRRSVLDQFRETAERVQDLDDSYAALRRQLAESAHELCGSEVGRRLEEPGDERRLAPGGSSTAEDSTEDSDEAVRRGAIPWSESIAHSAADDGEADGDTDRVTDRDTDRVTYGAARTEDMVDDAATTDEAAEDTTESTGNGDRPMTRTEAFRAARAARAASTASEETREDETRKGDGATSSARETAG